jgi:hypothetical protein
MKPDRMRNRVIFMFLRCIHILISYHHKTIGFGDITPKTEATKAVAIVFIPIAVGSMGYILGSVASSIVERRRNEFTKRLWSTEITMEDIEALDDDHEGGGEC